MLEQMIMGVNAMEDNCCVTSVYVNIQVTTT